MHITSGSVPFSRIKINFPNFFSLVGHCLLAVSQTVIDNCSSFPKLEQNQSELNIQESFVFLKCIFFVINIYDLYTFEY